MTENKVKTLGILGGYGPYATNDFFRLVLDHTKAKKDWEHLSVIIDSNPRIPSRARAFLFNEPSPLPYMLKGINRLKKAGASFFVCPCNSAHYFLKSHSKEFEIPLIDMVDATVSQVKECKLKRVGLLGSEVTVQSKLYETPLNNAEIELVNIKDLNQIRFVIEAAKQGKRLKKAKSIMLDLIHSFQEEQKVDAIIYGCTELPIILPPNLSPVKIYDSSLILATSAIKYAQESSN